MSSTANTKAGRGVDAVTVWSADGAVRFHRRLRSGARASVVLLDGDLLGFDDVSPDWQRAVSVLRLGAGAR